MRIDGDRGTRARTEPARRRPESGSDGHASPPAPVLVTGWFSLAEAEVTAGDLLALERVCGWLREEAIGFRVAMAPTFRCETQVDWLTIDPSTVSRLVFVCGPAAGASVQALFDRFPRARRICVGVSVVDRTDALDADVVIARDSPSAAAPDLSLGAPRGAAPVVGVVLSHPQPEYGTRQRHADVHRLVEALVRDADVAPVLLDTRLDPRAAFASHTPAQLESALARMDAVVTTRLHGLVLALRNGVPALALDPVAGGGKVSAQAAVLGWPAAVRLATGDRLEPTGAEDLGALLDWCLSSDARAVARDAAARGRGALGPVRERLLAAVSGTSLFGT